MNAPLTTERDLACHFYPAEMCPLGAAECRKHNYCPRQHEFIESFDVPDEGHDPDLDENGICRVCGKYEPE